MVDISVTMAATSARESECLVPDRSPAVARPRSRSVSAYCAVQQYASRRQADGLHATLDRSLEHRLITSRIASSVCTLHLAQQQRRPSRGHHPRPVSSLTDHSLSASLLCTNTKTNDSSRPPSGLLLNHPQSIAGYSHQRHFPPHPHRLSTTVQEMSTPYRGYVQSPLRISSLQSPTLSAGSPLAADLQAPPSLLTPSAIRRNRNRISTRDAVHSALGSSAPVSLMPKAVDRPSLPSRTSSQAWSADASRRSSGDEALLSAPETPADELALDIAEVAETRVPRRSDPWLLEEVLYATPPGRQADEARTFQRIL